MLVLLEAIPVTLLEKGYEIIIFDSLINSSIKNLERLEKLLIKLGVKNKITFFQGDIRDKVHLKRFLRLV